MRVLLRFRQSSARLAKATSAALIAVLAIGIGFAPAASASTTSVSSVVHTAGTVKPAGKAGPFYAGPYNTVQQCVANLDAIRQNPRFAGGGCYQVADSNGNIVYLLIYYLQSSVCSGVLVTPSVTTTAARAVEPAAC